jgi:hypothetical protein
MLPQKEAPDYKDTGALKNNFFHYFGPAEFSTRVIVSDSCFDFVTLNELPT